MKKECSIKQLSISLDQHVSQTAPPRPTARTPHNTTAPDASSSSNTHRSGGGDGLSKASSGTPAGTLPAHNYQPLLRIASLGISALLPAFAWLEVRWL
jgi:hypothetical protein